jgi:hypothetical protein
MSIEYYDKQGKPLTRDEYHALLEDIGREYKRVALTKIGDIEISTVWLGLDHQYGDGAPLIFETMQFGGDSNFDCERWSTIDEAVAGHQAWVGRIEHPDTAK